MSPANRCQRLARCRIAVAVLSAVAAGAAGCGGSHTAAGGGPNETHLTVAAVTATDEIPLWLAQQDGFFRQQGLNVTVQPVTTGSLAIPSLVSGRIDVLAGGNYVTLLDGQANGTFNIRVIAPAASCTADDFSVLALPHSGITKPSDLAGKTVSVPATSSVATILIGAQLRHHGVNPASVHYVAIPFVDASTALQAHRVAAISAI